MSLVGKETELVEKVEQYQLDIVVLTLMRGLGSGTSLLVRGWTLFQCGIVLSESIYDKIQEEEE